MNIKFKIKNACGEEKWWTPDEKIDYYAWSLGDGDFCSHCDKVLLCDVVDDYRSLCRNEPLLTKLIKIPSRPVQVKLLFQNWGELGDEWLKSFIFAYQEIGSNFYNAVDWANEIVWTGAEFDADERCSLEETQLGERVEELTRYVIGKSVKRKGGALC